MTKTDLTPKPQGSLIKSSIEIDANGINKIKATQMFKRLRRYEELAFFVGFSVFSTLELVRAHFYGVAISEWTLRGLFIPVAGLTAILTMTSSVSMQSALRTRGGPDLVKQRKNCILFFIEANDVEGIRLIRGISMAANIYALVFGGVVAMCIFASFTINSRT